MQMPWNPNVTKCVLHGVGSGAIFAIWVVVGIAWPILRWRVGAYATSLFVAFLLSFALSVLLWGNPFDWDRRLWFVVAIMATIFGFLYGGSLWKAASVR